MKNLEVRKLANKLQPALEALQKGDGFTDYRTISLYLAIGGLILKGELFSTILNMLKTEYLFSYTDSEILGVYNILTEESEVINND